MSDGRKYVEYAGGGKELYHLGRDAYELRDSKNPKNHPSPWQSALEEAGGM